MISDNTFKNVSCVTENYDGKWMGAGWYAYKSATVTTNVFGRESYSEHINIVHLRNELEMCDDYTDFIGDYRYAIAEVESNSLDVISVYFADDQNDVEDSLTEEYYHDMSETDPDFTEDDARELAQLGMAEIDEYGCCGRNPVQCDRYDVHFIN